MKRYLVMLFALLLAVPAVSYAGSAVRLGAYYYF